MNSRVRFVGIGGGTASGKTTLANELKKKLGPEHISVISVDAYYRSGDSLTPEQRRGRNYDHPEAIEQDLLIEHLGMLSEGKAIGMPIYDFSSHTRGDGIKQIECVPIIVVEGILALYWERLCKFYALSLFVEASSEVRFARRLERDIRERGRTQECVSNQWRQTVEPMYQQYCFPTKAGADLIVNGEDFGDEQIDLLVKKIYNLTARAE